jgi:hypothetical protein
MKTNTHQELDDLPKLDYCPLCHVPGTVYGDRETRPIGRYITKKSAPKSKRVWVECTYCELRTSGHETPEVAAYVWNRRRGKEHAEQYRNNIIRAAKIALELLSYDENEEMPEPSLIDII